MVHLKYVQNSIVCVQLLNERHACAVRPDGFFGVRDRDEQMSELRVEGDLEECVGLDRVAQSQRVNKTPHSRSTRSCGICENALLVVVHAEGKLMLC